MTTRQLRDLFSTCARACITFFLIAIIVAQTVVLLRNQLPHDEIWQAGWLIEWRLIWRIAISIPIFILTIFIPGTVLITRNRARDPFRFSSQFRAYYELPRISFERRPSMSRSNFTNSDLKRQKTSGNPERFIWSPISERQAFHLGEQRSILVRPLSEPLESDRKIRVEVLVQPKLLFKIVDSWNYNVLALQEFEKIMNWNEFRIETDSSGYPHWPSASSSQTIK